MQAPHRPGTPTSDPAGGRDEGGTWRPSWGWLAVALRYVAGESEATYVTRIASTLRSTLRDANAHFVSASSSYDYIQSDDTHPTYTGGTVNAGLFGGTTGSGAPRYTSFTNGKSPIWNQYGHERMGWNVSTSNTAAP